MDRRQNRAIHRGARNASQLPHTPNYWIVKGRPSENDFKGWLKPGGSDSWHTGRPPKAWQKGDRLFFWRTAPSLDVVGLGEFLGLIYGRSENRPARFRVRYLSEMLSRPIPMEQLQSDRTLHKASFLKSGPSGTVFPITPEQGVRLYKLVCWRNPFAQDVWPEILRRADSMQDFPDVDRLDLFVREGDVKLVSHLRIERDRRIVEAKKRDVLETSGRLSCEVCEFDFKNAYGKLGEGFCEVHHRQGLSRGTGERVTKLEDLAIVCSNCHRMLHRMRRVMSIERLRLMLKQARFDGPQNKIAKKTFSI